DWRSPLLMGITIPLSVVVAFIGLYAAGISLNVMSLGGLALGVGLLVDNSIVVLEAIHRRREMGLDARQAALTGTTEVAGAIIGGTLTNLVVFLPVIYVEGVAGQIFRDQALAVTFALLASLLVALTLVPALASRIRLSPRAASAGARDMLAPLRAPYLRALTWVLDHRPAVFTVSATLLAASLAAGRFLPVELLPVEDTGAVDVEVSTEPGMPFDELARVTERMERRFFATPGVRQTLARVGLRGNQEAVDALITAYGDGSMETAEMGPRLAEAWAGVAGSITWKRRVTLLGDILGSGPHDLSVLVTGDNVTTLREEAEEVRHHVAGLPMIQQAEVRWPSGIPEFRCAVDLDLVSSAGLAPSAVADAIQSVARGTIATTYYREEDRIEVILLAGEGEGAAWEEVLAYPVATHHGLVPLRRFLRCRQKTVPGEIEHVNGERTVRILVDVKGANIARAAREIGAVAERFAPTARNTRIGLGPEAAEMRRSLNSLIVAGLLAIGLQFAVMVFEFESFRLPFVVMFTVPMGLVGVMAGLLITGTSLGIVSGIGIVVLAGIVDNDAILLVDRTRQALAEGLDLRAAVVDAAQTRFRPVIMTTATTALGLLPMALGLGEGAELRTGLAVTILAGIIVATALTLLLVPALHLTFAGKAKQT
ncbi:efflux RND transporter permease subunit, partial [Candidatus Fermentibacteria bacterium]|nr:efflux RND transporter permease subunit [Candidatus Fermentibacteria bacterium]